MTKKEEGEEQEGHVEGGKKKLAQRDESERSSKNMR